jgi:hypothetical protein
MQHISVKHTELYVHIILTSQNSISFLWIRPHMLENEANSYEEFLQFVYHGAIFLARHLLM